MSSRLSAQEDMQARLQGLSSKWEELNLKMAERGDQLRQARQQDQLRGLLQVGQRGGAGHRRETEAGLGWEQAGWEGEGGIWCPADSGAALGRPAASGGLWPVTS